MKAPSLPTHVFSEAPPGLKEIQDVIHPKRNAAAPGLDGITYVPYKRCPAILPVLVQLFSKIWTSGKIPADWGAADSAFGKVKHTDRTI